MSDMASVFDRVIELANREMASAMQCTIDIPRDQDVLGTGVLRGTILVPLPHYITITIGFDSLLPEALDRWADDGGRV